MISHDRLTFLKQFKSTLKLFILTAVSCTLTFAGTVSLDTTFNGTGYHIRPFPSGSAIGGIAEGVVVQPDGKIVIGGWTTDNVSGPVDFGVMRFGLNGVLDPTFSGDGMTTTNLGPFDSAHKVLLQPDGKIILTGERYSGTTNNDFALARYLPDGSLDNSFDGNGVAAPPISGFSNEYGYGAYLQPDGKIVMVGTTAPTTTIDQNLPTDIAIMRFNSDGSLDSTFLGGGILTLRFENVSESANAVVVQPDGKILLGGFLSNGTKNDFLLLRLNSNGSLDTTFGTGGFTIKTINASNNSIGALALQADGKILAGGSVTNGGAIVRFNSNGTVDTTFGNGGTVLTIQSVSDLVIKNNEKILIGGTLSGRFTVSRYLLNGAVDTTFNNTGTFSALIPNHTCSGISLATQSDDKILVGGACYNSSQQRNFMAVARIKESAGKTVFDFDGDAKTDVGIFRPAPGEWWINRSATNQTLALTFGSSTDKTVPADFTGDGKTDIAFFRESTGQWFILRSEDFSFYAFPFGTAGDVPVPADFDADGKADAAIFRPSNSTWYIQRSSDNTIAAQQFGFSEDLPVVADYDADGKADIAIFRPSVSQWWLLRSTAGLIAVQFGQTGDKTVPGDYTGDGKADIAFWRPANGSWYIIRSEDNSFYAFPFGASTDIPTPGDYDGDGKFDAAVFRPSNAVWYQQRSTSGFTAIAFGTSSDRPIPNSFVR